MCTGLSLLRSTMLIDDILYTFIMNVHRLSYYFNLQIYVCPRRTKGLFDRSPSSRVELTLVASLSKSALRLSYVVWVVSTLATRHIRPSVHPVTASSQWQLPSMKTEVLMHVFHDSDAHECIAIFPRLSDLSCCIGILALFYLQAMFHLSVEPSSHSNLATSRSACQACWYLYYPLVTRLLGDGKL